MNHLEYGGSLELVQDSRLRAVDLSDKYFGVDVIVFVRVEGVQVWPQVLKREEANMRGRVAKVGVPRRCDAETALPMTDEGRRGEAQRRRRVVVNPASASYDVVFRVGLIRNRGSEIRRQPETLQTRYQICISRTQGARTST